ncbi:MarR family winged helix-turn-helix transcriptional regulator [Cupriavidus sp. BIC8F]|uniref:MarR family winged helix-turn-helix transcriptional regulator n=1 Tax=Cupriavidus sp. BIC8F TaxID=3079014 RepID=UPI0029170F3C|nr:MarR family transcriptional regulator [Cupriavidus sp. BIC8F]
MEKRKQGARTLRADAAAVLDVDLGWWSRLLARRITAELDEALASSGLSSTQFGLMCLIASATDDTLGALAQRAGLNQSTMSRNVDQLVSTGLVEVVMSEADRRRRAVWLTEAGAFKLQQALALWQPGHRALRQKLGSELHDMVGEVAARLAE